jgi:Zn-dependent protease with chaperone function
MVAGFVPPLRTLLLSDRLLDEMPRSQIAMVVLHEAAHLRRRHVPMRMAAIVPAWGVGALVSRAASDHTWGMILGSVVGIVLTMAILRWVAYRTEFDADVQACKMAESIGGKIDHVPASFGEAANSLAAALTRVTHDSPSSRKATWLHPSVADRIDWMRDQAAEPATGIAEPA